jgi:TonB family protein
VRPARPELANIRRSLQDKLIGERASKVAALTQSFTTALGANRLLEPSDSAKQHLLALISADGSNPVVATARQNLGSAYLREMRGALTRNDTNAAEVWDNEAHQIGFTSPDLSAAEIELTETRERGAQQDSVVGANSLQRLEYVAPKFPAYARDRKISGWVELEFTVRADGSTGDIVITNSSPRRTFDAAARTAIGEWRYKPVVREGKAVEQRAAVRIRFTDE